MTITPRVRESLSNYENDNPGFRAQLARIPMEGRLGGSGKLVILPVKGGGVFFAARDTALADAACVPSPLVGEGQAGGPSPLAPVPAAG